MFKCGYGALTHADSASPDMTPGSAIVTAWGIEYSYRPVESGLVDQEGLSLVQSDAFSNREALE